MKLLVCHPGASWSTADVHNGLVKALRTQGHDLIDYALDARIDRAASWLAYNWKRARKRHPDLGKPTAADVVYQAGVDLLEKALRHLPDWVLVVSGMYLHPDVMILLKRAGARLALICTESPYDDEQQAKVLPHVDVAWTNERTSVDYLRRLNPNVHYLPHAYDPERHRPDLPVHGDVPAHDVVFVGTAFQERIEILEQVDWTGIDLGLYGNWQALPGRHKLRRYVRGSVVSNDYAAQLYRKAKIGLNLYRTSMGFGRNAPRIQYAESLNPRALELAACGVFQVSDWRAEVEAVFGEWVPTIRTGEELEYLIRCYLDEQMPTYQEHREAAARVLPSRVSGRTFDAMAAQVVADLEWVSRPALVGV